MSVIVVMYFLRVILRESIQFFDWGVLCFNQVLICGGADSGWAIS